MRPGFAFLVTVLAVLSAAAVYKNIVRSSGNPNAAVPREIIQLYAQWKQSHGKLYATPAENNHRLQVFHSQKQFIDKANTDYAAAWAAKYRRPLEAPVFALNGFADLTNEEFRVKYTSGSGTSKENVQESLPPKRRKSAESLKQVTPGQYDYIVRSSGSFAPGLSFPFVEAYEKHYFDQMRVRMSFSQQELIDCYNSKDWSEMAAGVNSKGLSLASSYPYVAAVQYCNSAPSRVPAAKMLSYTVAGYDPEFLL